MPLKYGLSQTPEKHSETSHSSMQAASLYRLLNVLAEENVLRRVEDQHAPNGWGGFEVLDVTVFQR